MMIEMKAIPSYPGYYVTKTGEIYSELRGKLEKRKTTISKFGYERVALYQNKKHHIIAVHRLVAMAYIPNKNNYPTVNHKNENKLDNNVENLEWCSYGYNINYGSRNRKVSEKLIAYKTKTVGKKVKQIDINSGKVIKIWDSTREIERTLGIAHSNIRAVCNGERKSRGGYKWEYVV